MDHSLLKIPNTKIYSSRRGFSQLLRNQLPRPRRDLVFLNGFPDTLHHSNNNSLINSQSSQSLKSLFPYSLNYQSKQNRISNAANTQCESNQNAELRDQQPNTNLKFITC